MPPGDTKWRVFAFLLVPEIETINITLILRLENEFVVIQY